MGTRTLVVGGSLLILVAGVVFMTFTNNDLYDYNDLNRGTNGEINSDLTSKYHYLNDISEFPSDVQATTIPQTDAGTNMDTYPYSKGLIPSPGDTLLNFQTDAGVTLGRVIFYDRDLSVNRSISCADCHKQEFSFTDTARLSYGWQGPTGPRTFRNAMNLNHIRFHKAIRMYWDLRKASIEDQVSNPMRDPVEMGMSLNPITKQPEPDHTVIWDTIVGRLRAKPFYDTLFKNAYSYAPTYGLPDDVIDSQRIVMALAQFVRSINTWDSKWRKSIGGFDVRFNPEADNLPGFTAQEQLGRKLFMDVNRGDCQACHTRNVLTAQGAQNNGADGSITAEYGGGLPPKRNPVWLAANNTDSTTWNNGTNLSIFNDYVGKDSGLGGYRYWVNARGRKPDPTSVNDLQTERADDASIGFMGRMAVPSLINVGLTAPYFHDGRYKTLDQVINFYSDSIRNNDYNTLSGFLRQIDTQAVRDTRVKGKDNVPQYIVDTSRVKPIHYSPQEKAALKAFLLTLTDTGVFNRRWSNPFLPTGGNSFASVLQPILNIESLFTDKHMKVQVVNGQSFAGFIELYNEAGKLIRRKAVQYKLGINNFLFADLQRGNYTLKIQRGSQTVDAKRITM